MGVKTGGKKTTSRGRYAKTRAGADPHKHKHGTLEHSHPHTGPHEHKEAPRTAKRSR
jgi:hypothetical protein